MGPANSCSSGPSIGRQQIVKSIGFLSWNVPLVSSSSMVIRDLTLRSAASFGSFHLIRLLYDEYMFYLVEHRVAMVTGETSIAVMGEFFSSSTQHHSKEEDDSSVPSPTSGSSGGSLRVATNKSGHGQLDGSSIGAKRPKLS